MKKSFSLLLAACLTAGLLAGCGSTSTSSSETASSTATEAQETTAAQEETQETAAAASTAPATEASSTAEDAGSATEESSYTFTGTWATYPLCDEGAETLTMWCEFPGFLSMIGIDSYADTTTFAEAEKETGVHIEFTEVSMTNSSEQFSLMTASGDYQDLLSGAITLYGSSAKAIDDEIVIDLAEPAEEYMGNYLTILNDPDNLVAKMSAYNTEGQLAEIKAIADDYVPTTGAQIRQDWLDDLGLDTPVTYDDWEDTLKAFKNEYNCSSALLLNGVTQGTNGMLVGGYGTIGAAESSMGSIVPNMYVVDGEVKNGFTDDGYRAYLTMLHNWYDEGLISPDFITASGDGSENNTDSDILSGEAGIWYSQGNFIDQYEAQGSDGFKISGITEPYDPDYVSDGINHFGADSGTDASGNGISVSTACDNVELACQWLDYFFSEPGIILCNYGIEGEAFEYDDNGDPQFTDLITKADNMQFYMVGYTLSGVPTYQDFDKMWFAYGEDTINAFDTWASCTDSTQSIPSALSLTTDQSEEYSNTFADIQTMATEYIDKFITGGADIDEEWDTYVSTLEDMGLQDCIDIYQDAYDAYQEQLANS